MTGPTPNPLMMWWLNSHSQNNPRHSKCHIRFVSKDCSDRPRSHTSNVVLSLLVDFLTLLIIYSCICWNITFLAKASNDRQRLHTHGPWIILTTHNNYRARKVVQETKTWLIFYVSPLNTDIYTPCTETLNSKHDIPPLQSRCHYFYGHMYFSMISCSLFLCQWCCVWFM